MWIMWGTVFIVADGILTFVLVSKGGHEINPVLRFLIGKLGLARTIVVTKILASAVLITAIWSNELLLILPSVFVPVIAAAYCLTSVVSGFE